MIRGVLYGPGVPAAGHVVTVEPRSSELHLTSDGDAHTVPYADVVVQRGGWSDDAVLLEWRDAHGAWTLHVDGASLTALRAGAPDGWSAGLPRARRGPAALPMLAVVAALLAAVGGVLALLWLASDRLVDLAVARIPIAWEEQLGALTAAALERAARPVPDGLAHDAVTTIGARLAAQAASPYTFKVLLLDDPQVNAVAAPGGWVIVYSGLVRRARSAEELAGVLAHEVAHVVERHSLRGLVRQLGWTAVLGVLLWGAGDLGTPLATWAAALEDLRFSRRQESDADAAGLRLLERAGIDPRGLPSFFEALAADERDVPAFLATHPASAERARLARDAIGDRPPPAPLAFDWSAVQGAATSAGTR